MIEDLIDKCRGNGLELPMKNIRHCIISSSRNITGNDLIFLFLPGEAFPKFLIKIGRTEENFRGIINEYSTIQFLSKHNKGKSLTPTLLHYGEYIGKAYFVQSVIAGTGLGESLKKGLNVRTRACIEQSIDFIVDLFALGQILESKAPEAAAGAFSSHMAAIAATPLHRRRIEAAAGSLGIIPCFVHGDFWVTNVITDKAARKVTGVIDYEFAHDACYTFFDIFWFIANLAMFTESAAGTFASYKRVFFADSPLKPYYREILARYFVRIAQPLPNIADWAIISLLYASFREKQVFGKSLHMDPLCREMLFWTIENEAVFKLGQGA